jgi:hypothetical protein
VSRKFWTSAEDQLMRKLYPHISTAKLAAKLRRPLCSVKGRAHTLGLHKTQEYLDSPAACRLRRNPNPGIAYRYPKGRVPANKGLHRPGYSVGRGRMRETQFKKGQPPLNTFPMWSFRLCDGYLMLKTGKAHKPPNSGWEYVHRLVWEQANGPLPNWREGRIWWKDGNHLNNSLSNLEFVCGRDHVARTTMHNLPPAIREVIHLRGAINRTITWRTQREEQNRRFAEPPV